MAIRIRENGRIFCAALTSPEPGDTYIDDSLHYEMSVVHGVICTTHEPEHSNTGGEWWWVCNQPSDRIIDTTYIDRYMSSLRRVE